MHTRPEGYDAAKAALVHAIRGNRLPARIVERQDKSSFGEPDLHETRYWSKTFERGCNYGVSKRGSFLQRSNKVSLIT